MNNNCLPKVLAIYLPQFHETEDNDKWWGKGFTDWNTVKNGECYFEGHDAPWKPLNGNYYDLCTTETLMWQADLARKYGIDGFCFYHYYFKSGKKELERPAELLLNNENIEMQYCFNWASESWIRSWSRVEGNVWSEKYEQGNIENSNGVLVEQDYGSEYDWKQHFNYLLPFFRDERYIKIDEKPVFIFYRPSDIQCLGDMVKLWRKMSIEAGLKGLYLVGVNTNALAIDLDASLIYEPRVAINNINELGHVEVKNGVRCFDYGDIWDSILQNQQFSGAKTYFVGVSGYDDTPRRGKSGECLINNTPNKFQTGLTKLLEKSVKLGNEILLINAWNEWGEGMYLEPDERNGYAYLEAVKNSKKKVESELPELLGSINCSPKQTSSNEEIKKLIGDVNKYKLFLDMYDKWLSLERDGEFRVNDYLKSFNVQCVAIYGMGMLGKQLYDQLIKEGVSVSYAVDRYVGKFTNGLKLFRPEDDSWPDADMLIVTAYGEESIKQFVREEKGFIAIGLSEIITWLWERYKGRFPRI